MASLKEIVTKAVIGKAKKKTTTDLSFITTKAVAVVSSRYSSE